MQPAVNSADIVRKPRVQPGHGIGNGQWRTVRTDDSVHLGRDTAMMPRRARRRVRKTPYPVSSENFTRSTPIEMIRNDFTLTIGTCCARRLGRAHAPNASIARDHAQLADVLMQCKGHIILSGCSSPLMTSLQLKFRALSLNYLAGF